MNILEEYQSPTLESALRLPKNSSLSYQRTRHRIRVYSEKGLFIGRSKSRILSNIAPSTSTLTHFRITHFSSHEYHFPMFRTLAMHVKYPKLLMPEPHILTLSTHRDGALDWSGEADTEVLTTLLKHPKLESRILLWNNR